MADWFTVWAVRHGTIFGLTSDVDAAAMREWKRIFESADYTVSELDNATTKIATETQRVTAGGARFLGKMMAHLEAIRIAIAESRTIDYQRDKESQREDRGTCAICGNSGRVIVPHLASVVGDAWMLLRSARQAIGTQYTMAVCCMCPIGRWLYDRCEIQRGPHKGSRLMRLYDYERRNPMWRGQLEQRQMEVDAFVAHRDAHHGELTPQILRLLGMAAKNQEVGA